MVGRPMVIGSIRQWREGQPEGKRTFIDISMVLVVAFSIWFIGNQVFYGWLSTAMYNYVYKDGMSTVEAGMRLQWIQFVFRMFIRPLAYIGPLALFLYLFEGSRFIDLRVWLRERVTGLRERKAPILLGLLLGISIPFIMVPLSYLTMYIAGLNPTVVSLPLLLFLHPLGILLSLSTALFYYTIPVVILFNWFIQQRVRDQKGPSIAMGVTALLYTAFFVFQGLYGMTLTLYLIYIPIGVAAGFVIALLYERTGSLSAPTLFLVLFSFMQPMLPYVYPDLWSFNYQNYVSIINLTYLAESMLRFVVIIVMVHIISIKAGWLDVPMPSLTSMKEGLTGLRDRSAVKANPIPLLLVIALLIWAISVPVAGNLAGEPMESEPWYDLTYPIIEGPRMSKEMTTMEFGETATWEFQVEVKSIF